MGRLSRIRGCVLGLVLGDALGATRGTVPASGTLPATSAGQLACFTVEGLIRASVRSHHKGICHPPSVVWHAYHRWAALRGVPGVRRWQDDGWPDGWLARVPVLGAGRGPAPATVAALRDGRQGSVDDPVGSSVGAHGLTRSLPAALCPDWGPAPGRLAAEVAALTHGPEAIEAAEIAAATVHRLDRCGDVATAVDHVLAERPTRPASAVAGAPRDALTAARARPGQHANWWIAPDERAVSALAGAVYVIASMPGRHRVTEALLFAAGAGDGGHTATVTGALVGAAYGVDALPVGLLSRLVLAWVADTLARDLAAEWLGGPPGCGCAAGEASHRWDRYPGW